MIFAWDYDGVIVPFGFFPDAGTPMPGAVETLKEIQECGDKNILWTCREDHPTDPTYCPLTAAVAMLESHGVSFDAVNDSLEDEFTEQGFTNRRKVRADVYVDDCNLGGFPGWAAIRRELGLEPLPGVA